MKTKLGITVGLFGAGIYLASLAGGTLVSLLLLAYVLLFEENDWLKTTAVKATTLVLCFAFASILIGIVPDGIRLIESFFGIFNVNFNILFVSRMMLFFSYALSLVKTILFLLLTVKALDQGTINLAPVDQLIQKHYKDAKE